MMQCKTENQFSVTLSKKKAELQELIFNFDLNDIFNCNETSLFYRMISNQTLVTGPISGTKKIK